MKKFWAGLFALPLCAVMLAPCALAATYTPPFETTAQAAYLINLDSDRVIYEKNIQTPMQPGNLAQLMTVILTLEKVPDPAAALVTYKGHIQNEMYIYNTQSPKQIQLAGLISGDTLSVDKLLYAVCVRSANEAAAMLADYVGDGSIPYFVEMMNQRAQELGAKSTHFTSPHGLPDDAATTTAYDMMLLARHASTLPGMEKYLGIVSYDGGPIDRIEHLYWNTTNQFAKSSAPYYNTAVTCIKDSYIANSALGAGVLSLAKKDGYTYMLVVMGCGASPAVEEYQSAFFETNRLYAWAFDTFRVKTLLEKGKSFDEVALRLCWGKDFLRLMSADSFTALIPDEIEMSSVQYKLVLPAYVEAPIQKGALVGEVQLVLAGEMIGRVGVVSAEEVEASRALLLLDKLLGVTRTFWFKFIAVFLLMLLILYIALMIVRNRNRRRY
ncbi:MAG: serine hydrolase, partial [Oscillospiraceae bacterium]